MHVSDATVCMRVNNAFTGDLRVWREATALAEAGYRVTVLADLKGDVPARERRDGFDIVRVAKTSSVPYASLVRPMVDMRADVYHGHDIDSLLPCLVAGRRTGAKVIYDSHELWSAHAADKLHAKRRMLVRFEGPMVRRADGLITASPAYTEEITRKYNYRGPAETLLNTPLIRTDDELRAGWADRDATREARIGCMSVFQHGRGAEPLIRSLAHLPAEFVLYLIGPIPQPDYEARMREAAAPFGDRVRFVGMVPPEQIVPRLAACHVSAVLIESISLSYAYTSPNKLFDSLMAGTAIVASDLLVLSALVGEARAGVTCDVRDTADVARAIREAYENREAYGRNAREAAVARYNWETEKARLLGLYERVLAR